MNVHEIFEAIGLLVIGLLFYSYVRGVFQRQPHSVRRWQPIALGAGFGVLSVTLMRSGIQLEPGFFIDARNTSIALIGLFEGWPAALIAGGITAAARLWVGGAGAWAGVVSVAVVAVSAGLVHSWARRDGGVGPRHALALAALSALALLPALAMLGPRGLQLFRQVWLSYAILAVLSVGLMSRLFHDVMEQQRMMADQERFRAIIDEAAAVVRVVDADTLRILETNRADVELSGYSREEIIGKNIRDFWPDGPAGRPEREAMLAEASTRSRMHALNLGYRTRAGDVVPMDITHRFVDYRGRRFIIALDRDGVAPAHARAVSRGQPGAEVDGRRRQGGRAHPRRRRAPFEPRPGHQRRALRLARPHPGHGSLERARKGRTSRFSPPPAPVKSPRRSSLTSSEPVLKEA